MYITDELWYIISNILPFQTVENLYTRGTKFVKK